MGQRADRYGWPVPDRRDGLPPIVPGVDEIPLGSSVAGRLFFTGLRTIAADSAEIVNKTQASTILCLVEDHELTEHAPTYGRWLSDSGLAWRVPIVDFGVPANNLAVETAHSLAARLRAGDHVIVHCFGGKGRTSLIGSLALLSVGTAITLDQALALIATHRDGAGPETDAQRTFLETVSANLSHHPPE